MATAQVNPRPPFICAIQPFSMCIPFYGYKPSTGQTKTLTPWVIEKVLTVPELTFLEVFCILVQFWDNSMWGEYSPLLTVSANSEYQQNTSKNVSSGTVSTFLITHGVSVLVWPPSTTARPYLLQYQHYNAEFTQEQNEMLGYPKPLTDSQQESGYIRTEHARLKQIAQPFIEGYLSSFYDRSFKPPYISGSS